MRQGRAPGYAACIDAALPGAFGVGFGLLCAVFISLSFIRIVRYSSATRGAGVVSPVARLRIGALGDLCIRMARSWAQEYSTSIVTTLSDVVMLDFGSFLRRDISPFNIRPEGYFGTFPRRVFLPCNIKTVWYFRETSGSGVVSPVAALCSSARGVSGYVWAEAGFWTISPVPIPLCLFRLAHFRRLSSFFSPPPSY